MSSWVIRELCASSTTVSNPNPNCLQSHHEALLWYTTTHRCAADVQDCVELLLRYIIHVGGRTGKTPSWVSKMYWTSNKDLPTFLLLFFSCYWKHSVDPTWGVTCCMEIKIRIEDIDYHLAILHRSPYLTTEWQANWTSYKRRSFALHRPAAANLSQREQEKNKRLGIPTWIL